MFFLLHSQSSRRRMMLRCLLAFCCSLCLTPATRLGAQTATSIEYEIKAAFIYRLTLFMEWPTNRFSSSSEPIILCIAGAVGVVVQLLDGRGRRQGAGGLGDGCHGVSWIYQCVMHLLYRNDEGGPRAWGFQLTLVIN